MRADWIDLARRPTPRYTSYPTAAQFHADVGARDAGVWARALEPAEPISIYVHVPFCERICWYCGCHTTAANDVDARLALYVDRLLREIDLWAAALGPHAGVDHVHFGGGSPNALPGRAFVRIAKRLRATFGVRADAEFAVELDPRSLTPDRIAALDEAGVTRASLGVQTLSEPVQRAINRIQPRDAIERAIAALRAAGINALNADLMYGLPGQTVEDVVEAAAFAVEQGISRLAIFGYAHVPWFVKRQNAIDDEALPGVEARFAQAEAAEALLHAKGYVGVGLDHYAAPGDALALAAQSGTLRRNFQGYTTDACDTLVALGPSAISAFHQGYAQNAKSNKAWGEAVDAGRLAVDRGVALTDDDRLRARAIETLMCGLAVDLDAVCAEMGAAPGALDHALPKIAALDRFELSEVSGRRIVVRPEAKAFVRTLAQAFDVHADAAQAPDAPQAPRHALTV